MIALAVILHYFYYNIIDTGLDHQVKSLLMMLSN